MMTATRFFVYGSLTEGMVHYSKIQNFVESLSFARIKATAYRLKVGFPALVKGGSDLVPGQLVELKASDLLINLLDEFYGFNRLDSDKSLYSREEVDVYIEGSSEPVKAWTYFLNPLKLPVNASVITGGDWKKSIEDQPLMTSKLTEKQATYIQRLGRSSGREIVPIDLTLYRELMNLELIVDKGRRLALSKLGQEVFKHLG
ncbi:gamma-glutamylcyclotransferase [Bdellovibrio sp. KM01]|nr:gamma-glutamylcyclotransferase [Bdellovibrio sp. KM01]